MIALPGYYLVYGLLALVPGANPSISTETSGGTAPWFEVTTTVLGILALTLAAILNAYVLSSFINARRRRKAGL